MADEHAPYPGLLEPEYCPHCTYPLALCEFGPKFQLCLNTLQASRPHILEQYYASVDVAEALLRSTKLAGDSTASSSSSTAEEAPAEESVVIPGKRFAKGNKVVVKKIVVEVSDRGKKKRLTTVSGLHHFLDEKLKDIAKGMAKKFACSVALVKGQALDEQIQLQGDVGWDVLEYLQEKYNIKEKNVDVKRA